MTKPVYDWEGLRAKIEAAGLPQHKTMVACYADGKDGAVLRNLTLR